MWNRDGKPRQASLAVEQLEDRLALNATSLVTGLYHNLLGRAPDATGLAFWVQQLSSGAMTNQQVATGIWDSAEHRGIEVANYYELYLGRAPDAAGLSFWVNRFLSGQDNELTMEAQFITSPEFILNNNSASAYVTALYIDILGRTPSISEESFWDNELAAIGTNAVAVDILTSAEAYTRVITNYYEQYLNRAPDNTGLSFWLNQLQTGTGTLESVAEGILGSAEYAADH